MASPSFSSGLSPKIPATVGYYAIFVCTGLATAALGPTLAGLAAHAGSSLSQISILLSARAFGNLLGALGAGRLYERFRGHPLMVVMVLGMGAALALAPLAARLWILTAAFFLVGLTKGTLDVGGNSLLIWQHGRNMGPFMNGLHFFWGLGAFLFPVFVAQSLLLSGDVNWSFWVLALLIVPAALWLVRLPSPPQPASRTESHVVRPSTLLLALLAVLFFLYVGAEASYHSWVFSYATAKGLAGATQAAYLTSLFWATFTVGRLLSIPIAFRARPRDVLAADLALTLLGVGLVLAFPSSAPVLWVGSGIVGLGMASAFPTGLALAERRMTMTSRVTSTFFVAGSAGGMVVPWLIGQIFESAGPGVTMVTIAIDVALALVVLGAVLAVSRGPSPTPSA